MRRVPLLVAAIAAAALAVPVPASAESVPAQSAAAFRDSIGVQTHIIYYDTAYGAWPRIVQKLDALGVDHLRDGVYGNPQWPDWNDSYYKAVELAVAHGHRFLVGMGEPNFGQGTLDQLIGVVRGRLRGAVEGLEAPNEYDLFHGGPNWAPELGDYQRQLYLKAKADPLLRDLPVVGPSLVYGDSAGKLGSLESSLDMGNIHPYSGGEAPSQAHLRNVFGMFGSVNGSKPYYASETGFHNALAATEGQPPVSEQVGGDYLLRAYLEHFRAGIRRTYAYELIDENPDPGMTNAEQHFGMLRNDFSEKPSFVALKRMLATIGRPSAVSTSPLDLTLSGDTDGVQKLLLQDGPDHYQLVLWQAASEWDTRLRRALSVPDKSVSLALPADAKVTVSRPARSADASVSSTPLRTVALSVPADPIIVDLDFSAPPVVPPPVVPPPVVPPPVVKPPVVKPPVVKPPTVVPCPPRLRGAEVILRQVGTPVRVQARRSLIMPNRVNICAARDGTALIELGLASPGGHMVQVLVSRQVSLTADQKTTVDLPWTAGSQLSLRQSGRSPVVRVTYSRSAPGEAVALNRTLQLQR